MSYVLSIAFQFTGAIILLLNSLEKLDDQIRSQYSIGESLIPCKDGKVILSKKRVKEITHTVSLNRCAFFDLVIGYLLTIIAEPTFKTCYALVWMLVFTMIITGIECFIAFVASELKSQSDSDININQIDLSSAIIALIDKTIDENKENTKPDNK